MPRDEEDFLSRWSRRKVESRRGLRRKEESPRPPGEAPDDIREPTAADTVAKAAESDVAPAGQAGPERGEPTPGEPERQDARADEQTAIDPSEFDDVDFDKLDYQSDYTRFMQKGVPEHVRRRALRALWQSDPILANLDGLNDYDDDFTDAALAVKELITSWKPDTGYLTEEERRASYGDAEERSAKEEEVAAAESAQTDGPGGEEDFGAEPEPGVTEAEVEPEKTGTVPPGSGQPDNDKA